MKLLYYTLKIRFLKTLCNLEAWAYSDYASNPQWWNSLFGAFAFIVFLDLIR